MYRVQRITSLSELRSYARELQKFEQRLAGKSLFLSYRWIEAWIRAYLKHFHLSIFIVWQDKSIVAFLPLVDMDPHKLHLSPRRLEFVSLSSQGDLIYIPCLGDANEIAGEFFTYLRSEKKFWDYIYLESLFGNDPTLIGFTSAAKASGFNVQYGQLIERQLDWYIPLEGSWDDYYESLSLNFKKQLKRKFKRGERDGGIKIHFITTLKNNDEIWEKMLEVDRNSWQYKKRIGLSSHKNHSFYLNLAREFSDRGLNIWLLEVGGKPAAFEYSIAYDNKIYGLRWGYHRGMQSYSPGQLLRCYSLKYYIKKGYKEFDLLGKFDESKKRWTKYSRDENELLIFNDTFWGKYLNLKYNPQIHGIRQYIKSLFS